MAARRKIPAVTDEVAKLRDEYLELIREGLGTETPSPAEERAALDDLGEHILELFYLAAKVRLAEKLGITDWLKATVTGAFPEKPEFPGQEA